MHHCNLKVSGKSQPGKEKGQGSGLARSKDTCFCQGRSASSKGQRKTGGHRNDAHYLAGQGNSKAGCLETVLCCIAGGQQLEEGTQALQKDYRAF